MRDCVIVGKGPAGISAALYLKRANVNCVIVAKDYGALEKAHLIENYYGNKASGLSIAKAGEKQALDLGIDILDGEVIGIEYNPNGGFIVKTNKEDIETKKILLATGKARSKINVENFANLEGKGISYCALCDGFFYRKKKLGIIGSKQYMLKELEDLKKFTNDITVFTNGEPLEVDVDGVKVVTDKITKVIGENRLEALECSKDVYQLDGLFIAIGTPNAVDFSKHIGLVMNKNDIVVDGNFMTNIEGIYACGDVVGGTLQINKAVNEGMIAALAIKNSLKNI